MESGAQWLSGRVLDARPKGRGFEPHRRHCVMSMSKNIDPSLVLVQPRKTRPFITERLLMGRKESNKKKLKKKLIESWIIRSSHKLGFTLHLQETRSIHDSINFYELNLLLIFTFYYKYLKYRNYVSFRKKAFLYLICNRINGFVGA